MAARSALVALPRLPACRQSRAEAAVVVTGPWVYDHAPPASSGPASLILQSRELLCCVYSSQKWLLRSLHRC